MPSQVWMRPAGGAGQVPMYIYRDDAGASGAWCVGDLESVPWIESKECRKPLPLKLTWRPDGVRVE